MREFVIEQKTMNDFVKNQFYNLKTKVEQGQKNHQAAIQDLETKFVRISDHQSSRPTGTLLSNTQTTWYCCWYRLCDFLDKFLLVRNYEYWSNAISSISIDESRTISRKGPTVVSHGTQDGRACVVKRVNVLDEKYRSDFFYAATKLYSCSDHNNIVTIYETKFDGKYCNIAMEPCTCNFVEFAENPQVDYHLLKILMNDVVLEAVHLHYNGVIHGSICPSNVLLKSTERV
ncbi:reverse transcriptase domain-containing protein [Tanacetum coccineum]